MTGFYYYRHVADTWHILHTERTTPDELKAFCGECCMGSDEGYAAQPGRRDDPRTVCPRCHAMTITSAVDNCGTPEQPLCIVCYFETIGEPDDARTETEATP